MQVGRLSESMGSLSSSVLLTYTGTHVKFRPKNQAKSLAFTVMGSSYSENRPNEGYMGVLGIDGGTRQPSNRTSGIFLTVHSTFDGLPNL